MMIKEYLTGLQWDGKPRVATFFDTYATGADEFDATKWFVSAVARAMNPGCRVDTSLVLCGPQGAGKTRLLSTLFGEQSNDGLLAEEMSKCWIVEVDFDLGLSTKAFFTTTHDTFYPRYEKEKMTVARTCVIVAHDMSTKRTMKALASGSRRFWPVNITACEVNKIAADRDQLWAEAKHMFDNGTKWWN